MTNSDIAVNDGHDITVGAAAAHGQLPHPQHLQHTAAAAAAAAHLQARHHHHHHQQQQQQDSNLLHYAQVSEGKREM